MSQDGSACRTFAPFTTFDQKENVTSGKYSLLAEAQ